MLIVLMGPHGVGKSTMGELIAQRLGGDFDPELGKLMALDPSQVGISADQRTADFDRELMAQELSRDRQRDAGRITVVETWHPGNLAYAELRDHRTRDGVVEGKIQTDPYPAGGRIPREWIAEAADQVRRQTPLFVLLSCCSEVLKKRQSEPGDPAFFHDVGARTEQWVHALGGAIHLRVDSSFYSPEQLVDRCFLPFFAGWRSM